MKIQNQACGLKEQSGVSSFGVKQIHTKYGLVNEREKNGQKNEVLELKLNSPGELVGKLQIMFLFTFYHSEIQKNLFIF